MFPFSLFEVEILCQFVAFFPFHTKHCVALKSSSYGMELVQQDQDRAKSRLLEKHIAANDMNKTICGCLAMLWFASYVPCVSMYNTCTSYSKVDFSTDLFQEHG